MNKRESKKRSVQIVILLSVFSVSSSTVVFHTMELKESDMSCSGHEQ